MKKKVLASLLTMIVTVSLAACGSSNDSSTSSSAGSSSSDTSAESSETSDSSATSTVSDSEIDITMVLKATAAEYWQYMIAGAEQAGEDLGVNVSVIGPTSESEIAQQVSQIEEQIAADVDALIIAPCEENAVIGATQDYVDQLPILFVDTDANLDGKKAFIGTGNANAAKLGGDYVSEVVGEGGNAILIGGQQGEATSTQRLEGFQAGLEEGGVNILETQYGNNTADGAMSVVENLLTKYQGEIDAILCMNDDMAIGVENACENAGVDDITIVGFNGDVSAVSLIQDGKMAASVAQQPYLMAYQAVEQAYKSIQGEEIEVNQEVDARLITIDNADEYLQEQEDMLTK